jgi:diguanylate cyclase (GGDEF)-like protein/PAS domain S-box-containing protein
MTTDRPQTTITVQKWQWNTDAAGVIQSVSPSFVDATGIDPENIIGKTFAEISTPVFDQTGESDKKLKRYLDKCKNRQGFRNIDLPISSPINGLRLIKISGAPEFGKRKKFTGYSGSGIDTTIEIEKKTRAAAAYLPFADVLEGLGDGFAIWDSKGNLLLFNKHFKTAFGSLEKNVRPGASLNTLSRILKSRVLTIEPDTPTTLLDVDRRRDGNTEIDRQIQFSDGSWATISARKIESNLTATTIADITNIKNREVEATRDAQRNAQMAVAISAMDSGVVTTNPNMPDNPIVFSNPAFISPTGVPNRDILGNSFKSLFEAPENEEAYKHLKRCMRRRETCTSNLHLTDLKGSERWFELRVSPILNETNQISYFLGIQNDITVQKNAEIDLENRMSQQSAVAELGGKALAGSNLYELFNEAITSIAEILDVKFVNIRERLPGTDKMTVRAAIGWKKKIVGLVSSTIITGALIDTIFATGKTKSILRTDADIKREGSIMGEKGIRSSIGIRIAGREHPFGILAVHCKETRTFTSDEVNFLETIAYVLGVAVERSQAEDALKDSEYRFELAVKGSNDGIWDSDLQTQKMYYSSRWKAMLGLSDDAMGDGPETWIELTHIDDRDLIKSAFIAHLKNETPYFSCEHRMLHHDGSYRWMLARGLAIRDENDRAIRIAGSLSDITEAKRAESQLLKDALHDTLTNLPNRALFTDRLVQSLTRSSRQSNHLFAVMFLDFDRFKLINDSLGHSFGDHILIEIGQRLKDCVRDVDTVARLGGDEFAILLDDLDSEKTAEEVARRINHSLGQPFVLSGREIVSNASIGIAFSSLGYSHPEEMIRDADIAMYQAKSEGRARHVVFEQGMHVRAVSQLELETNLRQAIEKDQFTLAYQPVVDITTEKLIGFEALIRWIHPENGFTPPGDFIPIAEETKLIIPIGRWVIWEACRQLKGWQTKFPNLNITVSVNISPEQFKDNKLIDEIREILDESKLDGKFLKVEITESAIMENPFEVTNRLIQLREMGIQLHVDDFGTGYSSLSQLHRFPIDALKIDRSFVISMSESQENMEIVRTIIALAHNLGLGTVAEGVESKKDQKQLQKLDCDLAQGYYFSKPLNVKDATKFINKQNKPAKRKKKK